MKILHTSSDVRRAIKDIFSSSKGRRVVVTAFVGKDARAYLSHPKGIELICWPKAGGTNPNELRELVRLGAKVSFADSLHMKIYWAEKAGVVITSANLSTSALGAGGLKEAGVLLPSEQLNIDRIVKSIKSYPITSKLGRDKLLALDKAHAEIIGKAPHMVARSPIASFCEWYEMQNRRTWKLCEYENHLQPNILCDNAKVVLKEEHGSANYFEIMGLPEQKYNKNDWLLCYGINKKRIQSNWMFADHVIKISRNDKAYDRDYAYQTIQVHPLKLCSEPPFVVNTSFNQAFSKAVDESGGTSKIPAISPSKKLIDLIYKNYKK